MWVVIRFELWILFDPLTLDSLQFKSILFKSPLNPSAPSPAYIFSLKLMFVNTRSVYRIKLKWPNQTFRLLKTIHFSAKICIRN